MVVTLQMYVHHIVAFLLACKNIFGTCDGFWDFYKGDEKCLQTYRPIYAHACMWSIGYFTFDTMLLFFVIDDLKTPLGKQTLAHHILSSFCILGGFYNGHSNPLQAQACLLSEISGVFLSIRTVIGKNAHGVFALINSVMIFLTFTIFRMIHFPFCLKNHFKAPYQYNFEGMTFLNLLLHYSLGTAFFIICLMNVYWYKFIVNGIMKVLRNDRNTDTSIENEKKVDDNF